MSFKFDLQTFAIVENYSDEVFNDDSEKIIYAKINKGSEETGSYVYWLLNHIKDIDTVSSIANSTSPDKDYWNQDREVFEMAGCFCTQDVGTEETPTYYDAKPLYDISRFVDKDIIDKVIPHTIFNDIDYINNAVKHIKLKDKANMTRAFAFLNNVYTSQFGYLPGFEETHYLDTPPTEPPATVLDLTPIDFSKAYLVDYLLYKAKVNVDATGFVLNPKVRSIKNLFALEKGYVKGVFDIDYSHIKVDCIDFLPAEFIYNANLEPVLGAGNKVIKFKNPPRFSSKGRSIVTCPTYYPESETEHSEYILDLSNIRFGTDGSYTLYYGEHLFYTINIKEIIFPEGFTVKFNKFDTNGNDLSYGAGMNYVFSIIEAYSLTKVTNLAIDFTGVDYSSASYMGQNYLIKWKEGNIENIDPSTRIKFINFDETSLFKLYKQEHPEDEYTLERMYKEAIQIPMQNIEFVNKK